MQSAVINLRIDSKTKKAAQKVAEEMGLTLSDLIQGFLRQVIKTKTVTFSTREEPSEWMIKNLAESKRDIAAGRVVSFETTDDAIEYLDKLIAYDKQSNKNRLLKKVSQTAQKSTLTNQDSI